MYNSLFRNNIIFVNLIYFDNNFHWDNDLLDSNKCLGLIRSGCYRKNGAKDISSSNIRS